MIEFKTSKGEFIAVEIPNECHISQISVGGGDIDTAIGYPDGKYNPLGINYCLICKISEATEEDAREVVIAHVSKYVNTHLLELHSILKSKGIDINKGNWYLFKKI